MAIDYDNIMTLRTEGEEYSYADREVMLYALGVGFGRDPMNEKELPFVYEEHLQPVPTMANVIAWGAGNMREKTGVNYTMVLHGEQRLTLHRQLPIEANVIADTRVVGAFDKGAAKGAVIVSETELRLKASNLPLVTLSSTMFARGDGGFLKDGQKSEGEPPAPHPIPDRAPDHVVVCDTRPDQALLYRLSGDRNPLHADPKVAKEAGFKMPILHGLGTYGTCCRAIITSVCNYDASKIRQFNVRFSSPVYPGENITTEIWQDGNVISFRAWVKERDTMVINNGKCVLAD